MEFTKKTVKQRVNIGLDDQKENFKSILMCMWDIFYQIKVKYWTYE